MPKAMKLIDGSTNLMQCKTCEHRHVAMLRPSTDGGGYYRGSWQCSNLACPTRRK